MKSTFNVQDMETYFKNYVPCRLHKKQPITNFCTDPKCAYLCPQCIQDHSKLYSNHYVYSIRTCIIKTQKKLLQTIEVLEEQLNKNNGLAIENVDQFMKRSIIQIINIFLGVKEIQQVKLSLFQEIESYFNEKENQLRNEAGKYSKVYSNLDSLKKQLVLAIKQLKFFKKSLFQTSSTVDVIQKANKIDYSMMVEHFRRKLKKIEKQAKINIKLDVNSQKKQQIKMILKDLIEVKTKDQAKNKKKREQFKDSLSLYEKEQFAQSRSRQAQKKQFITSTQQLSADRYFSKSSFLIERQNYFKSGEPFLHFFQVSKANLHIIKLSGLQSNINSSSQLKWEITPLNIQNEFSIPSFHKTIATEQGVIYLIGGTQQNTMKKSPFIYQYTPSTQKLKPVSKLNYPRSSYSMVCVGGKIFIAGGIGNNDAISQCQLFNTYLNTVQLIAPCIYPTINSTLCYIEASHSIVKLGGIFATGENNDHVEVYDINKDNWIQIDPIIELQGVKGQFGLLSCSGWVGLNKNQIYVYGGYNQEKGNESSAGGFILEYSIQTNQYSIKHINVKNLPIQEGFWSQQGIVYKNIVYALQNIDGEQGGDCLEDQRNVLLFDGKYWKIFGRG